jgi:hypothetical protein
VKYDKRNGTDGTGEKNREVIEGIMVLRVINSQNSTVSSVRCLMQPRL